MNRIILACSLAASTAMVIPKFFVIGFTHILPQGLDHILFILALFVMTRGVGVLMFQMTLFTLAHSLSLGLSTYGVVSAPASVVEIAIALSIAFIAIENLLGDRLSRWRPAAIFFFGLIHGLGFAHSFQENLVASGDFLPALFSFNLGIEFGQLAVIGLAYAATAAWSNRNWYQPAVVRPVSMIIAASGFYWMVERSL
jgi:hypothetical protein